MDYLFETLIEKRKAIKKEIKIELEKGDPLGNVDQLKALEQILKLIGNTIFGVISSPYFDINALERDFSALKYIRTALQSSSSL